MTLPTRGQVETVRRDARHIRMDHDTDVINIDREVASQLARLALRVLDAPERETTEDEQATWGTCPECGKEHGWECVYTPLRGGRAESHPARLAAAPTRVRLVSVP